VNDKIWYKETEIQDIALGTDFKSLTKSTPYRVVLPANGITPTGQERIELWLWDTIRLYDARRRPRLPDWWVWEWAVTRSEYKYVGTMPKRISKWVWKEWGIRLKPDELAEIGVIAKQHTIEDNTYVFDIAPTPPRWTKGDFGDPDSCYFGVNISAQDVLASLNATALRIFRPIDIVTEVDRHCARTTWCCDIQKQAVTMDTHHFGCMCNGCTQARRYNIKLEKKYGQYIWFGGVPEYQTDPLLSGWGRCWVVPHDKGLVLFNAYGHYQLFALARILATLLGLSYRKIEVTGDSDSLWINGSHMSGGGTGGAGYLLNHPEILDKTSCVTLNCDNAETGELFFCTYCEDNYDHEDTESIITTDDGEICDKCYENYYDTCSHCNNIQLAIQLNPINDVGLYCPACREQLALTCDHCGDWYIGNNLIEIRGMNICTACKPEASDYD